MTRTITSCRALLPLAILACLAAALTLAGTVWGMGSAKPEKRGGRSGPPPVPVLARAAITGNFPVYFQGLGTVTPQNTVTVRSRVDGELRKLHFTEGQEVAAGDLLAEIDPRNYEAELAQAEGQMLRDQALLRNAQQDLARYRMLLARNSVPPQQVDTQASLVQQYEAALVIDKGRIDAARLQLSYCRITAPAGGRLGLKLVDQGNVIRAADSTGIVVITQMNPIAVVFSVTESQLPRVLAALRKGGPLVVEAWDRTRSTRLATGSLLTTDNRIDTATGTVKLKAVFDNSDGSLFPNQFVNARILVETLQNAVIVPTAAVQYSSRGAFVYVVENGVAILRDVTPGEGNDTVTVITRGIAPGDVLVIDGLDRLRDKTPVIHTMADGQTEREANSAPARNGNATAPGRSDGRGEGRNPRPGNSQ